MPFSRPPALALIKWAALFRVLSSYSTKKPSGLMPKQRKRRKERKQRPVTRATGGAKSAGAWFEKLVELQARLRDPLGCPWDIEQTHLSLRTYLIEEAYEVLEALESGDDAKFAEELGDMLLQVVFHAQIATEEGRFTAADVVREIHQKMVRRHPHVFGENRARDAAEVLKNWEQIKAEERRRKGFGKGSGAASRKEEAASLLDGIPHTLPAVMEGFQLTRRASRIGFDWTSVEGVVLKLQEELDELGRARAKRSARQVEEEIGDVLFAAVNLARFLKVDPEIALKRTNAKFSSRFRAMEGIAQASGRRLADVAREEMESLWNRAKAAEQSGERAASAPRAGKR
jgi:tetrapyrrole methylase family protein / MazG family protein